MSRAAEMYLSSEAAGRIVGELQRSAQAGHDSWAGIPAFAAGACGVGFAEHGRKIAAAFEGIRAHGYSMYEGFGQFAPAVGTQLAEFAGVDVDSSASVRAIGGALS